MLLHTARRGASLGEGKTSAVEKVGSGGRTRTCDSMINSHLLYRLNYSRNEKSPRIRRLAGVLQFLMKEMVIFSGHDKAAFWQLMSTVLTLKLFQIFNEV